MKNIPKECYEKIFEKQKYEESNMYGTYSRVTKLIVQEAKKEVFDGLIADWTELNKKYTDGNKAFADIGKLIRGQRHLSTSHSEGTELS